MEIYSFKTIERSSAQQNLYDLFQTTLGDNYTFNLYEHLVTREEAMRLDIICKNIYGDTRFIEEIGFINNILNPFSIQEGDIIYYFSADGNDVYNLYYKDNSQKATNAIKSLVNPAKDTNPDETIPTIIPEQLQQISVDYNTNKIKIMDSFE